MSKTGTAMGTAMASNDATHDREENLSARCRNLADNSKLPSEICDILSEASQVIDWQRLCLTGLKVADIDTIAVLAEQLGEQARLIQKLQAEIANRDRNTKYDEQVKRQLENKNYWDALTVDDSMQQHIKRMQEEMIKQQMYEKERSYQMIDKKLKIK